MTNVVILCDYFEPSTRAGGPVRSIARIVREEGRISDISIVTRDHDLGSRRPFTRDELQAAHNAFDRVTFNLIGRRRGLFKIGSTLRRETAAADLVYLNSVMSPAYTILPIGLMRLGVIPRTTVLVAPRGELSPAALGIKPYKKRVTTYFLRRWFRYLGVVWHASSDIEAKHIRNFMRSDLPSIVVRSNPAPPPVDRPSPGSLHQPTTIAFVGRVVPIKNFNTLLLAARDIDVPLHIIVAGALEQPSYLRQCQRLLNSLPPKIAVDIRGHLSGADVSTLLSTVDAMVLPTSGENFGQAIAEALAVGCPVMVPDTTPWTPVICNGGGWIIDAVDPAPLTKALGALDGLGGHERGQLRKSALRAYQAWWNGQHGTAVSLFDEAQRVAKTHQRIG